MEHPKISLKAVRVNANLTQREAADRLGISLATLQNYENGVTTPDWNMVNKMEFIYQYPIDYIKFTPNYA